MQWRKCFDGELRNQYTIKKYRSKISGPLWDRFDIKLKVPRISESELFGQNEGESSKVIRERVKRAWEIQSDRYRDENVKFNGKLTPMLIKKYIPLTNEAENTLRNRNVFFSHAEDAEFL